MAVHRRLCEVALILGALCLLASCAGSRLRSSSGSYSSPHSNFEVPIPAMGIFGSGTTVEESSDERAGRVVFHGDLGFLKSITYLRLPTNTTEILGDVARREAAVRGFLHDYALPQMFKKVSAESEILLEEPSGEGLAAEYFAVVLIPEGSTIEDMRTGKRLDSMRALLIFPRGGYMYMLGYASALAFVRDDTVEAFATSARESLDRFRATIQFN